MDPLNMLANANDVARAAAALLADSHRRGGDHTARTFGCHVDLERALEHAEWCDECQQIDVGQQGEYPCPRCDKPTVWDAP